jgi:predicted carbohydrate-binding protein with CBM48
MTDHETDPLVQRAVEELRRLPTLDRVAVARIATAAAAARLASAEDDLVLRPRPRIRWWMTVGLAAAAGIIGFVARDLMPFDRAASVDIARVSTPAVAPAPVRPAASTTADIPMVPQQFVLEQAAARSVSVVGDFNNWNPKATPMVRSNDGGPWSTIVPLVPGRHKYGFMVDDSIFTLDPRTAKVRDPDFGTEASVLMVGRP